MPNKETLIFFLASLVVLALSYFNIIIGNSQLIIALILIIILVFINRTFLTVTKISSKGWYRSLLLFLGACIVQLLVVTTGIFYSPLLILLLLFAIGVSFFTNAAASIHFLLFSLATLSLNILLNQNLRLLFYEDPWSTVLYVVSFIMIAPLIYLISRRYSLKDTIYVKLIENIKLRNLREESILSGLTDFVIVTDRDLRIVYANEPFLQIEGSLMEDILGRILLTLIPIEDETGRKLSKESLTLETMVKEKTLSVLNNVYITLAGSRRVRATLQIRPIVNLEGDIHQFAFVLTNPQKSRKHSIHGFLEQSRMRHTIIVEEFKKIFTLAKDPNMLMQIELYGKIEDDLLTATEIEDHPIKAVKETYDSIKLVKQVVEAKREFAQVLGVKLNLVNPSSDSPVYLVSIDPGWINLVLRKLLDIAILLAYRQAIPLVELSLEPNQQFVNIGIRAASPHLEEYDLYKLFVQYYADLGIKTTLRLGSGLEGFIVKTITTELGIALKTTSFENGITFALPLPKAS